MFELPHQLPLWGVFLGLLSVSDAMRQFTRFHFKDSNFRICSDYPEEVIRAIRVVRAQLEAYIERHPEFRSAFHPLSVMPEAPPIARRMARGGVLAGVGPMAAVAGAIAQAAAEAALQRGASEAIVENGGDLYAHSPRPVVVGLYTGPSSPLSGVSLRLRRGDMPIAVCSSSGMMGHSVSRGACDLATVLAEDAALADAAATLGSNLVRTADDIGGALAALEGIRGIRAAILVKDDRVGMCGNLPELVRVPQPDIAAAVTRDPGSTG